MISKEEFDLLEKINTEKVSYHEADKNIADRLKYRCLWDFHNISDTTMYITPAGEIILEMVKEERCKEAIRKKEKTTKNIIKHLIELLYLILGIVLQKIFGLI